MKMFALVIAVLLSPLVKAEDSKVVPVFLEAAEMYVSGADSGLYVARPELNKIISVLAAKGITPEELAPFLDKAKALNGYPLAQADKFDSWKAGEKFEGEVPEVALQAFKMDVVKKSEIFFKDDVYVYFFMTDGVIPTGKVSSIYKGVGSGESFFLNEVDRAIFPLIGIPAKRPDSHLIVDYGIIESDGDDIKKMQKLSAVIIDIAIAVYAAYDPQHAEIVVKLRQEIKTLADLLLTLNSDDRLATGSFGFKSQEIADLLKTDSYVEFTKKHKKDGNVMDSWEYHLNFRLLRK